ncbi:MAG: ribosomal protein L7/L12 [Cyanobacteria bacterium J06573_11]
MTFTLHDLLYLGLLTLVVSVTMLGFSSRVGRLESKIGRVERGLTLLMESANIEMPSLLSERVKQIAKNPKRKIEAIRAYREETGAGLKEAKEAVEEFMSRDR